MKRRALLLIPWTVFTAVVGSAQTPELVWETTGFAAPESVVFDAGRNQFYVSNMGTHGRDATPGDGFISRVSPDGRILDLRWVTGFDNPKGLALANGRLYVGDDKDLVEIDPETCAVTARHAPADGPGLFNDCTADSAGNVYVCSGRLGTVFRLSAGKFAPWCELDRAKTGGINGLKAEQDRLLLGGWSLRGPDGKEQPGHISTISYAGQTLGRIGDQPLCHIDGLEPDGQGGYTVTDWLTGDVLHVTAVGKPTPLMTLGRGTADHTYLPERRLLVIPLMNDNVLRAYRWAPAK
ncbi:MAG: SMP-30/gluconolactonase/LRE family protein [Verrucomicrobiota bacterium]